MIAFFVPGIPAPQGSKRAFVVGKRAVLVESSKACKPWRDSVRAAALEATQGAAPLSGPLSVSVAFILPRPKSVPKGRLGWPATKPDIDKLLRSTLDGLTAVLFGDDSQVVEVAATKRYQEQGTLPSFPAVGAAINCWHMRCEHAGGANGRGHCVDCGEVMR